jgi:hypothetical protein
MSDDSDVDEWLGPGSKKVVDVAALIMSRAILALEEGISTPRERELQKNARKDFMELVGTMLWLVRSDEDAKRAKLLRALFVAVMAGSFNFGTLAGRIMLRLQHLPSTSIATEARKAKSRVIDEIIREKADVVWSKHPKRSANWVAVQILGALNNELACSGLPIMKIDAIRKRLNKILATDKRPAS